MLEAKGRIELSMDIGPWIHKSLSTGITLVPLESDIAILSTRLLGKFHGDPDDRIIIASAQKRNATLITADTKIIEYWKKEKLKVLPIKQNI